MGGRGGVLRDLPRACDGPRGGKLTAVGRKSWVVLLLGILLTTLAYRPALDAGFFFDDRDNIERAAGVHWTGLSFAAVKGLRDSTWMPRRVVANATFALNHLVGGLEPRGYHLVNVFIHLGLGLVLSWVAFLYVQAVLPGQRRDVLAMAAVVPAVVFLVHPLNTQAVTYVVQRMASLAALFCLLGFGAYLVGRSQAALRARWPWYAGMVLFWSLALGSKENAVLLALVIVTYEVCFHRRAWQQWWGRLTPGRRTGTLLLLGVLAIAAAGFVVAYIGSRPIELTRQWPHRDFNGWQRMLSQFRVQLLYLSLLVWPAPSRLNLDHDMMVSRGLVDPAATLAAGLFWMGVVVAGVVLAVRRPRYGFPLLAYLEWHLVEAGPVNLELVFEHRMYLPLTMLVLLGAVGLAEVAERWRRPTLISVLLLALPLAWGTWQRNLVWADAVALHWDTARKSPNKFRPWYNLGTLLGEQGQIAAALLPLQRAVALRPGFSAAHNQLGNVYYFLNRKHEALAEYQEAVRLDGHNAQALHNLGMLLEERGRVEYAIPYYRRFVEIAPPELSEQVRDLRERLAALEAREGAP